MVFGMTEVGRLIDSLRLCPSVKDTKYIIISNISNLPSDTHQDGLRLVFRVNGRHNLFLSSYLRSMGWTKNFRRKNSDPVE